MKESVMREHAVTTTETGRFGEAFAEQYLIKKGYRTIGRNVHMGRQELDLVMLDGETVVFVEVKARKNAAFGTPAEFVTRTKQRNLTVAAERFLHRYGMDDRFARFDIVEIYLEEKRIRHLTDAFSAI